MDSLLELHTETNTGLMSSPPGENEEIIEEFITDGNTGATREMYHVSKQ